MTEILGAVVSWPTLLVAVAIFGFFPGIFARLISLSFRKGDPRRQELIAEVYAVPRWERPFWVAEQLERAISEGLSERLLDAADGRLFNRWRLGNGVARNQAHPDTFSIPASDEIARLVPGDLAKLMFEVAGRRTYRREGANGERMWVEITMRKKHRFRGTLANHPIVWNRIRHGDEVKFRAHHIIDITYQDEL